MKITKMSSADNFYLKFNILFYLTVAGLLLSIVFHFILSLHRNYYPYNTFLFAPSLRGSDFVSVVNESSMLNPYLGYGSAQYPLLCIAGYLISVVVRVVNAKIFYLSYVFTCSSAVLYCFYKIISNRMSGIVPVFKLYLLIVCSYPFLFSVDRGNFELLVFTVLVGAFYFYDRGKFYLSALMVVSAASMKLFPLYYLIIFLKDRRYREIAFSIGMFILINVLSLSVFYGGVYRNLSYLIHGGNVKNNYFFDEFINSNWMFQKSISMYNFIKIIAVKLNMVGHMGMRSIFVYYKVFMIVSIILLSLFIIFKVKEFWIALLLASIVVMLLPFISADYKMLYLFLPIIFFLQNDIVDYPILFSILMGLALIPKSYYFLNLISDSYHNDITIAALLNPLLLCAIMALALYEAVCMPRGTVSEGKEISC